MNIAESIKYIQSIKLLIKIENNFTNDFNGDDDFDLDKYISHFKNEGITFHKVESIEELIQLSKETSLIVLDPETLLCDHMGHTLIEKGGKELTDQELKNYALDIENFQLLVYKF